MYVHISRGCPNFPLDFTSPRSAIFPRCSITYHYLVELNICMVYKQFSSGFHKYLCSNLLCDPGQLPLDLIPKECPNDLNIFPCYVPYHDLGQLPLEQMSKQFIIVLLNFLVYIFIHDPRQYNIGTTLKACIRIPVEITLDPITVVSNYFHFTLCHQLDILQ